MHSRGIAFYFPGLSGWGIAYYINDTMIPVLRLRRNVTYTFIVEAGNNPNDGPNYHPFYITDSEDGGILLDTPEERAVNKRCLIVCCQFRWSFIYRERMSECLLVMTWIPINLLQVGSYDVHKLLNTKNYNL